ncbi:MAG: hypothetical protein GY749_00490 [Desulfobacteraceae bacterium]|nr:hypothetical protein [Desulfobacteraceae bacterium]
MLQCIIIAAGFAFAVGLIAVLISRIATPLFSLRTVRRFCLKLISYRMISCRGKGIYQKRFHAG